MYAVQTRHPLDKAPVVLGLKPLQDKLALSEALRVDWLAR